MAEDVGKKLMAEVQTVGLDELLYALRAQHESERPLFDFRPLDGSLDKLRQHRHGPVSNSSHSVVELLSLGADGVETQLLYHLCVTAVLPQTSNGGNSCVVILDTEGNFDVSRLANHMQKALLENLSQEPNDGNVDALHEETLSALKHIHLFQTQSLASVTDTLRALPEYLFKSARHHSYDREVAFIAMDSATAFYWQDRAETEDAHFVSSTTVSSTEAQAAKLKAQSGYIQAHSALKAAMHTLRCPAIVTTSQLGALSTSTDPPRALRPQLPSFPFTLRMVLRRLPVKKFPSGVSIQSALQQAADREQAVDESKFELFVNQWGLDERLIRGLEKEGSFYPIRIEGVSIIVKEDVVVDDE